MDKHISAKAQHDFTKHFLAANRGRTQQRIAAELNINRSSLNAFISEERKLPVGHFLAMCRSINRFPWEFDQSFDWLSASSKG